jgi:hypothetical protein
MTADRTAPAGRSIAMSEPWSQGEEEKPRHGDVYA